MNNIPGEDVGSHRQPDAERDEWNLGLVVDCAHADHKGQDEGHDHLCNRCAPDTSGVDDGVKCSSGGRVEGFLGED